LITALYEGTNDTIYHGLTSLTTQPTPIFHQTSTNYVIWPDGVGARAPIPSLSLLERGEDIEDRKEDELMAGVRPADDRNELMPSLLSTLSIMALLMTASKMIHDATNAFQQQQQPSYLKTGHK